ncbi:hypothetical protein BDW02DRAFT_576514 [Decorospora gaudefroyi]|uniref:Osmotin, thaumatin-like protein n=1 Tax=Decorospora gaudefroyi TaxID=184978 RepID=A0A6A5KPZ2_9PLEO|nr:hypothetical protein BDW02DRAFT_576514 [Decorospora gaudefroyi]
MTSVSNWHLFCLVLIAVPSTFQSVFIRRTDAAPASGIPDLGTSTMTSLLGMMSSTSNPETAPSMTAFNASPYPSHNQSFGWVPDTGPEYGAVTIRNNCSNAMNLWSVGAHPLNGPRSNNSWDAWQDSVMHSVLPGSDHTEPYRTTCPAWANGTEGYCPAMDKLSGQGVAIKISAAAANNLTATNGITQLEYALVSNPNDANSWHTLNYDVSLLDCGAPPGTNGTLVTDVSATDADYARKTEQCPGYQGGLTLTFEAACSEEYDADICDDIHCEGKCSDAYMFDRTREGEPSKACRGEFRGDMVLMLCAQEVEGGST